MWPANIIGKKKKRKKTGSYICTDSISLDFCVRSASTWLPLSDCQRLHWSFWLLLTGFSISEQSDSFHLNVHQFPLLIKQHVPWFANKEWLRPFSHYDLRQSARENNGSYEWHAWSTNTNGDVISILQLK